MENVIRSKSKESKVKSSLMKRILKNWQLYTMILPAVLYLAIFQYKPMYGVLIAFKDFNMKAGIMGSEWVGFEHFTRLFNSYWFPIILKNTLSLSLLSLVIGFPIPIILALMVNEIKNEKMKRTWQTVSYAPHFISVIVVCGMVTLFLNPTSGIINQFLNMLGIESIFFMQNSAMFKWVYVISGIWQNAGWGAIIYFAALSGVDKSLIESAEIDGANRIQKIWYINFPVLVPTMTILLILRCGRLLGVGYEKIYLLQNATNISASEVISTYVYKTGLINSDFSFSTAVGLFNAVINAIILIMANRISKKVGQSGLW